MTQEKKEVSISALYNKLMRDEKKALILTKCIKDRSKTPTELAEQYSKKNPDLFAAIIEHGRMKGRMRRRRDRDRSYRRSHRY